MVPTGLTSADAAARLAAIGPNRLPSATGIPLLHRVAAQFSSPVVYLPLAAAFIAFAIGDRLDATAIVAVLVVNAIVGLRHERSAAEALHALQAIASTRAKVRRDGQWRGLDASEVVPDDLVNIEAGDHVPADGRLIDAQRLTLNEAALTGESIPVPKEVSADSGQPSGEHMVFMGTAVAGGTGMFVVTQTGAATEVGQIARLLASTRDTETPLRRRLAALTRTLSLVCVAIVALVFVLGEARGWPRHELFLTAISLAIAAIPEGLPAVVTVALALGVQRMARQRVLVRRLEAIETLGCTTVICTDKTGTLTTGAMTVREITGDPKSVLETAAACCDATLTAEGTSGLGDAGEVAILQAAAAYGIARDDIEQRAPRQHVIPFDPDARAMTIRRADGVAYIKGALDVLASRSPHDLDELRRAHDRMAARALRVLAVGTSPEVHGPVTIVGLLGIADPPRHDAGSAVAAARDAGVRTIMITGDHPATAEAIARELRIIGDDAPAHDHVHARTKPADKLEIVRRWKARGDIVAMIGDGVNDAPALREAHVGVAMHLGGTDVTREAADLVLTDNSLASLIAAIREGRAIFENIRKTVMYLLTGNLAELTVMAAAAVAGVPAPLLPRHLLWINLVTDSLPALALVADPPADDLMRQPPRDPRDTLLGRAQWRSIAGLVAVEAAVTLASYVWALRTADLATARGVAFSTLVFSEVFRALAARHRDRTFWEVGPWSNPRLALVIFVSALLQIALVVWPVSQQLLAVGGAAEWLAVSLTLALVPVSVVEMQKLVARRSNHAAR